MRKLGIVIALCAAATLGMAGTASAQEQVEGIAKEAGCPINNGIAEGSDGAFDPAKQGGQDCSGYDPLKPPNEDEGASVVNYLCDVGTKVMDELDATPLGAVTTNVSGGVKGSDQYKEFCTTTTKCEDTNSCDTGKKPSTSNNGGGGGGGTAAVQAANAGADGGLPRTGGELFAGAGFGLMSLGALVRRFLP